MPVHVVRSAVHVVRSAVHVVRSAVDGRLAPERVLGAVPAAPEALSVLRCGPEPLVEAMSSGLRDRASRPAGCTGSTSAGGEGRGEMSGVTR